MPDPSRAAAGTLASPRPAGRAVSGIREHIVAKGRAFADLLLAPAGNPCAALHLRAWRPAAGGVWARLAISRRAHFGQWKALVNRPADHPVTPDGRYFVVNSRLWRRTNPALSEPERQLWVDRLMRARREVGTAMKAGDGAAEKAARAAVDAAKHALGERGPVWWTDGAPDFNRRMVGNTPYKEWFESREGGGGA